MRYWHFLALILFLTACSRPLEIRMNISNPGTQEIKADGCVVDQDCTLHNVDYAWQCCWQGRCDAIDYSKDNWIAVNVQWLTDGKSKYCPSDCGPAPMCPTTIINASYIAQCVNSICMKVG